MQAATKIDKTINTFRFKRKNKATMRENRKTVRSINIKNAQLSPWFFSTFMPQSLQCFLA